MCHLCHARAAERTYLGIRLCWLCMLTRFRR